MTKDFIIYKSSNVNWSMSRPHFHEHYEILLPIKGKGSFFINRDVYEIEEKSVVFISNTTLHHSFSNLDEPYELYVLHFHPSVFRRLSLSQVDLNNIFNDLNFCASISDDVYDKLRKLFEEFLNIFTHYPEDYLRNLTAFLNIIVALKMHLTLQNQITPTTNHNFSKIMPVLDYIDENLKEKITTESLSEAFYMNKFYLCHLFKKSTGFTIVEYINNRRILHSQNLLRKGISVQASGEESGFINNANYIRTFKQLTGITPGNYAKQYKASASVSYI